MQPLQIDWCPTPVDIFEQTDLPPIYLLFFAISKVELADWMPTKRSLLLLKKDIVAIYPHRKHVVRY